MVKTFDSKRQGGGTVSIVRDAQGNYVLKETGFDKIAPLQLPELGAVAATTTAAKTETAADKTGTTTADQTKAAFLLPKKDDKDDEFTTEKMLKSATDVSESLQTTFDKPNMRQVAGERKGTFDADTFDDTVGTKIKDPTESVFGRSTVSQEQLQRQDMLPSVETPQSKLKLSAAEKEKRKPTAIVNFLGSLTGPKLKTEKETINRNPRGGVDAIAKQALDRQAMIEGATPDDPIANQLGSLGISADPSKLSTQAQQEAAALGISTDPSRFAGSTKGTLADPLEKQDFIDTPTKQTFVQSVGTALKDFVSPAMAVVQELGRPVNSSAKEVAFNKAKFNIVTSSGPMQGRIVGDDGSYDPANNLFHGMNRTSKFGNLRQGGQKRIDKLGNTIGKLKAKGDAASLAKAERLQKRQDGFIEELNEYNEEIKQTPVTGTTKPGESGGSEATGSSKIVCTMMNQSYGFGSFRNKIWMKFHKDLAPEYQKGYHRLFLPLVRIAKTNKIIKNILEHIAVHSTIDMRQSMRGKKHLLGRVYRKILLPICYWAGKK